MGKKNYREIERLAKLKHENQKLKREISLLRKQLSRTPIEISLDDEQSYQEITPSTKKDRTCWNCNEGTLKFVVYNRRDGDVYQRLCSNKRCNHRTRLKRLTPDVDKE